MTNITKLSVKNIRSHQELEIDFSGQTTVITGSNGSGKTTLLEAIYIAFRGKSFKGTDQEILNFSSQWWRIDLSTSDEDRSIKYDSLKIAKKKQFDIDGKVSYRLPVDQKKPIVLFEPEDLRLIHGSPARRRLFIDRFILQLDKNYSILLSRYDKAIRQRNALLQDSNIKNDELFAWNVILSDYGAKIIKQRYQYTELLNETLKDTYNQIAGTNMKVNLAYSRNYQDFSETLILKQLNNSLDRDRLYKNTSIGPHRHDIVFNFADSLASKIVSRGEARTIVLALKLSELAVIKNIKKQNPLVLLDDVFSELDHQRQVSLAELASDSQVIITSAHTPADLSVTQVKLD